jgi:hypothetical protein
VAVDARREGMVVIARTDARAGEGFQAALDRAGQYIEAGADMTFLEAPQSMDEVRQVPHALGVPQLLNIVGGGKTPVISQAQGAVIGMQRALAALRDDGAVDEASGLLVPFNRLRAEMGGKFYTVFDAVSQAIARTPRSSSLVENLNSRLRNYFTLRRHLGSAYLDLLRFFLNHRRFMRSQLAERIGKSPRELMTGESHPHWLILLGFGPLQNQHA